MSQAYWSGPTARSAPTRKPVGLTGYGFWLTSICAGMTPAARAPGPWVHSTYEAMFTGEIAEHYDRCCRKYRRFSGRPFRANRVVPRKAHVSGLAPPTSRIWIIPRSSGHAVRSWLRVHRGDKGLTGALRHPSLPVAYATAAGKARASHTWCG